jgi:prepilin-type N-terminal cleavage/methylation domain-containing protein/prepilin-type processing-associated H-X9-DG protein
MPHKDVRTISLPHRTAFTLVEILVVIGIIAVLIAILLPTISKARESANHTSCMSNMRQLTIAWTQYATQHDGKLVSANTSALGDWVIGGNTLAEIQSGVLYQYCAVPKVYHCPSDYSNHLRSFSINSYFNGGNYGGGTPITQLDATRRPSETYVFVEEFDPRGVNLNSFVMPPYKSNADSRWIDVPAHFHGNGSTLGFADSHAEYWVYSDNRTRLLIAPDQTTANNQDLYRFEHGAGY